MASEVFIRNNLALTESATQWHYCYMAVGHRTL